MIDFLSKTNTILSFIKLVKEYKAVKFFLIIFILATSTFSYGLYQMKDNSIYIDSKEDHEIREAMKAILIKCGDKHAMGLSTISTEVNSDFYAKFKEIFSCDYFLNQKNCLVDLSSDEFPFAGDYIVDHNTYKFLTEISQKEDVQKIYTPEFDIDDYPTIKNLLKKSIHFKNGTINNLYLTATQNNERNLIYAIHLVSWSKTNCIDIKYLLNKFRNKLPKSK